MEYNVGQPSLETVVTREVDRSQRAENRLLIGSLVLLDAVSMGIGFILAYIIRFYSGLPFVQVDPIASLSFYRTLVVWLIPVWLISFALFHLYSPHHLLGGTQEYANVVNASTLAMMIVVFAGFLGPGLVIARGWLLLAWLLIIIYVGLTRFLVRRVIYFLRAHGHFTRPTIIVGANPEGQAIAAQLASATHSGLQVIGFLDDERPVHSEVLPGLGVLGSTAALVGLVSRGEVAEIIVVSTAISRERLLDIFQAFGTSNEVGLLLTSGLYEIVTTGVRVRDFGSVPLLSVDRVRLTGMDAFLKAILDYSLALIGLVVLSPLLFAVAIAIKLDSRGPVFHRRRVLGLNGQAFDAFKFRSMVPNADAVLRDDPDLHRHFQDNYKLRDDPRVTGVGRVLRRASLDELPQLLNVLRGEMSLVGPRMITPEELPRYGKWGTNLLTVKPGITGLWQISGRSDVSYDERVKLDMYYVRNYSIWFDLWLILQTIPAVLQRHGAY